MPAVLLLSVIVPVVALIVRPVVELKVPAVAPVPSVGAAVPVLPTQPVAVA